MHAEGSPWLHALEKADVRLDRWSDVRLSRCFIFCGKHTRGARCFTGSPLVHCSQGRLLCSCTKLSMGPVPFPVHQVDNSTTFGPLGLC